MCYAVLLRRICPVRLVPSVLSVCAQPSAHFARFATQEEEEGTMKEEDYWIEKDDDQCRAVLVEERETEGLHSPK